MFLSSCIFPNYDILLLSGHRGDILSVKGINDLLNTINHIKSWLINLQRAKNERKIKSMDALQSAVIAVWETMIYLCKIPNPGKQSAEIDKKLVERGVKLSNFWLELSHNYTELKLDKLSKYCKELGQFWKDPKIFRFNKTKNASVYRKEDLERLKARLEETEQIANKILDELL